MRRGRRLRFLRDGCLQAVWIVLLLGWLQTLAAAQEPSRTHPRVILALCDGLTIDDLRDPAYPALYDLAQKSAVGLMNGATAGPRTPVAAALTLALGQQQPAEPTDALAYRWDEDVPGERGTASDLYARRTGLPLPQGQRVVHLGLPSLARRNLSAITLGAALAAANPPLSTAFYGNADTDHPDRCAALLTLDRHGVGQGDPTLSRRAPNRPFGRTDPDPILLAREAVGTNVALCVVQFGDTARAEAARGRLSPAAYREARVHGLHSLDLFLLSLQEEAPGADLILVSPAPPNDGAGRFWNRLTPILASGPHFASGLLTSPTTRTRGLVANIDVAPTLLSLFHAAIPAEMVGRTFYSTPGESASVRLAILARMDYVATLNAQALTAVTIPLGGTLFLIALVGLVVRRFRGGSASRRFAPIMVVAQNLPAGLLLGPLWVPPTLWEYGLRIAAWMVALTGLCYLVARPLRIAPPLGAALTLILLVVGDTFAGQPLLKDSLLSGYALSGIRYYGVGNEYLGALLGMALAGGFAWLDDRRDRPERAVPALVKTPAPEVVREPERSPVTPMLEKPLLLPSLWLLLALDLGWPGLGANAGSVIVTTAGFGVGAAILRGRKPTVGLALGCALCGLALSFGLGALDATLAGHNGSHAGVALHAATHGRGAGYLLQIALRKMAMNLRLLFSPYLLLGAGVVAATVAAAVALLGREIRATLQHRPWTVRSLPALLTAVVASLLFKDSGVVTVTFLIGAAAVILLWYVLTDTACSGQESQAQ